MVVGLKDFAHFGLRPHTLAAEIVSKCLLSVFGEIT